NAVGIAQLIAESGQRGLLAEDREIDDVPRLALEEIDVDAAVDALGVRVVIDELAFSATRAREIEEQVGRATHLRSDAIHRARRLGHRVEGNGLEGLLGGNRRDVEVAAGVADTGEGYAVTSTIKDLDDKSSCQVPEETGKTSALAL